MRELRKESAWKEKVRDTKTCLGVTKTNEFRSLILSVLR